MCLDKQDRPDPVLVQNSGLVDDDMQLSEFDVCYEMDGRKSSYIEELLDWYREEDARGLRRSELNVSVESTTCLKSRVYLENVRKVTRTS